MKIERPKNYFCRGEIEVHKAMQRQTEREIKRMRRWAEEDERMQQELDLEYIGKIIDMVDKKFPDADRIVIEI